MAQGGHFKEQCGRFWQGSQMGASWEGIYVPNQKLDAIIQRADDADIAIRKIIGAQSDPIVRHRLNIFYQRLQALAQRA